MRRESGDQLTLQVPSNASACRLTFVGALPSGPMTQTSASVPRSETNAIFVPSAEYAGTQSPPGSAVSWRGVPAPSAAVTQTSSLPDRSEVNAIDRPSGDHAGDQSFAGPPTTTLSPMRFPSGPIDAT